MVPTLTQVFWRQPWTPATVSALSHALHLLGWSLRELSSQSIDLVSGTVGGLPLADCAFVAPAGPNWSCLHLPSGFTQGDELAVPLAKHTGQPVLVLTEHQQVAWGFALHPPAEPTQRFLSLPSLWENTPTLGTVDLPLMSQVLGISVEQFAPYLTVQSADDVSLAKAFPDDRFAFGDSWIRVDFLRALGITYPIPASTPAGRFCLLKTTGSGNLTSPSPTESNGTVPPEESSPGRWN